MIKIVYHGQSCSSVIGSALCHHHPQLLFLPPGPEGITFTGTAPPLNQPVETPPDLPFELRTPDRLKFLHANIVCEVTGDGALQQSSLLETPPSEAVRGCSTAIGGGRTSVPYSIVVTLHESASIRQLTTREIVISFLQCDPNNSLTSEPLLITGIIHSTRT